jgi:nucleoside-diphosphate-sugar epimerase
MKHFTEMYTGKRVMVTGGLGMLGSAVANKLVKYGANVTIVDACIEPYGANLFNIQEVKDSICLNISDIRDTESMKILVKDKDIIFNFAGQVSHNDSMENPIFDAEINYIGHINVLENVKRYNPIAVVLHAGSRLEYGRIESVPVNENHPVRPRTPYGSNKRSAENMYLFYNEIHKIPCVLFRIANPYGPRSQMKHNKYSMINWFIRQAMENKTIKVFGSGDQIRDYIFVEDLADAFLYAAVTPKCIGQIFNIGSGIGTKFIDMVNIIIKIVGSGNIESIPWPDNYINVETGDYISDINKICSFTGWKPLTNIEKGIFLTYNFYKENRSYYW